MDYDISGMSPSERLTYLVDASAEELAGSSDAYVALDGLADVLGHYGALLSKSESALPSFTEFPYLSVSAAVREESSYSSLANLSFGDLMEDARGLASLLQDAKKDEFSAMQARNVLYELSHELQGEGVYDLLLGNTPDVDPELDADFYRDHPELRPLDDEFDDDLGYDSGRRAA